MNSFEQGPGVVRARRGLRVVLDGEDRQLAVPQSLDGAVVQVHVRDLERRRPGNRLLAPLDGEAVVLRGDQDPAGLESFTG